MKVKILIVLVILIGLIAGYFWYQNTRYESIRVARGNMELTVSASGTAKAEKVANLRFSSTGRIISLPFRENDEVKNGQAVATIDTSDLKAIQDKELKDYEDARRNLEHLRDKYKDQILTDAQKHELEELQNAVDRSVIDVEIADRAGKNASVYSPFSGVVIAVNGELNEWTNAFSPQPLITIADFSTIYFDAEVSEENSDAIKVGQEATVTIDAHPKTIHKGTVTEISRQVKKNADGENIVPVKIVLSNAGNNIKLNFKGDAQIVIGQKENVLLVPKNAVEKEGKSAFVSFHEGYFIRKKPIELGEFNGTFWEVTSGLSESDEILIRK